MAKYKASKSSQSKSSKGVAAGTPVASYNINIAAVDPNKKQFEPTEKDPVRQHYKMAGG